MTLPVFIAPELDLDASFLELAGPEGGHARRAMRLGIDDQLEVTDGKGGKLRCRVVGLPDHGLALKVDDRAFEPLPKTQVVLVQALAKGGRDELAVQVCTELGADGFVPWHADRSVSKWAKPKAEKNRQKWENVVWSATKQARRAHLPTVAQVISSAALGDLVQRVVGGGGLALLCHEEASDPLPAVVASSRKKDAEQTILIIVGPEGGVSEAERAHLALSGAKLVMLGHSVLRSSTAGAAALTAVNYLTGRWLTGLERSGSLDQKESTGHESRL